MGTFFPSLFTGDGVRQVPDVLGGVLGVDETFTLQSLLFPLAVSGCAVVAWVKYPRQTLPLLALVLANAALSLLIYRTRNQIVGMIGLYSSAGIGLVPALRLLEARARSLLERMPTSPSADRLKRYVGVVFPVPVFVVLFVVAIALHADAVHDDISKEKADYAQRDPCGAIGTTPGGFGPIGPSIPERLRAKFNLEPTKCPPARPVDD